MPTFVTDPQALREARLQAAKARQEFLRAKRDKRASVALHRAWTRAKARVAVEEVRAYA